MGTGVTPPKGGLTEEAWSVMECWTWPYILQQVVLLGAWFWLMRMVLREVREILREEEEP